MPSLPGKDVCSGCGACHQICPRNAITMIPDSEGFKYPTVDGQKCVECSLCERACLVLNPFEGRHPLETYAFVNSFDNVRLSSSSGGAFHAITDRVIQNGGIVFGVSFDNQWKAIHKSASSIHDLCSFMGSKYMQSDTGGTFSECERYLKDGREVLYSGTPCQISGLKHFLRKDYENLLTVDVICHGVPSPKVWKLYLDSICGGISNVESVNMRDKKYGWADYSIVIDYSMNGSQEQYRASHNNDIFMQAFLKDMILRPSCYACHSKGLRSGSDITLGDFWGVDGVMPEINDNKGVSLVLFNTEKGRKAMDGLNAFFFRTSYESALRGNPAIVKSPAPWPRRAYFFSKLDSCRNIKEHISDSLTLPSGAKARIKSMAKSVLGEKFYFVLKKMAGILAH